MYKNVMNGSSLLPENKVWATTENAPSCRPRTTLNIDAMNIFFEPFVFARGLYMRGYAIKQGYAPRFHMLHPRASIPPSAKKSDCTVSTDAIARNAA